MSETETKPVDTTKAEVELIEKKLKESLDKSSSYNRNMLTIFLGIIVYVFITAATTTDKLLLIGNSMIKLPIIGYEVPLLYFYKYTPVIILIFHLNLLINLSLHFENFIQWFNLGENKPSYLTPFVFNYSISYKQSLLFEKFLRLFIMVVYYILPIYILMWIAYKFLPYHDITISIYHNSIVTIDGVISILFYLQIKILYNDMMQSQLIDISGIPKIMILFSWLIFCIVFVFQNKTDEKLFHTNISLSNRTIASNEVSDIILHYYLFIGQTKEDALRTHAETLDLRKRDFSYADFNHSKFIKADLSDTNFEGAILTGVDFKDTILKGINLERANLSGANLKGISLYGVNLNRAILTNTNLERANLSGANLERVDLTGANLEGVDLSWANLESLKLSKINFKGTILRGTHLEGADLTGANLEGVDLSGAYLNGATLSETNLKGAILRNTYLEGVRLRGTNLEGVDLSGAHLSCWHIDNTTTLKGIYYDNINISNKGSFESNAEALRQCELYGAKSKDELWELLDISKDPRLFLDINKKMACDNTTMTKRFISAKGSSWYSPKYDEFYINYDNNKKVSFNYEIERHVKENCPKLLKSIELRKVMW
ncbi:MAG: pentapeptide repeat-containing protein [Nitrospirota bacterium]